MKKLMQILMISTFTLASASAFANDSHRSTSGAGKTTKSERAGKSNKRKSHSSKLDQQILAESRAEGGPLSSQEEIDELRESLGEK